MLGVPLSWHKTSGGDVLVWVGFELLLRSRCVGISSRRAEWFARGTQKIADSETVNIASFEEGLGRIMLVAGGFENMSGHFWALLQHTPQRFNTEDSTVCEVHSASSIQRDH